MKETNTKTIGWNPPHIKENEMIMDTFRKARGGNACMLTVYCVNCDTPLLFYQKDGKGTLYRCYLDRIIYPYQYKELLTRFDNVKDLPQLKCSHCGNGIGTPMVYEKEDRFAFGLFMGKFYRRISK